MKLNNKVKVNKDIPSINGMLHKNTIVTINEIKENNKYKVTDALGKIWWVNKEDISG